MPAFLAAGDVLINPSLLAYVVVETDSEGLGLRLGFGGPEGQGPSELRVGGLEARSLLGWLRRNARFLDAGGPPSVGAGARAARSSLGEKRTTAAGS